MAGCVANALNFDHITAQWGLDSNLGSYQNGRLDFDSSCHPPERF